MLKPIALLLAFLLTAPGFAQEIDLDDETTRLSYAFGVTTGQSFKSQDVELDVEGFVAGFKDANNDDLKIELAQVEALITAYVTSHREKQSQAQAASAEKNLAAGQAWLKANASKPGVVELPSGLQYKVISAGDGPKPSTQSRVTVHYRGTVADGTEFDSSYSRGQPATFPVTGVIKGWTEALQLMTVGSKWELYVPSELAYGPNRRSDVIGPNQMLIFEVELLSIE